MAGLKYGIAVYFLDQYKAQVETSTYKIASKLLILITICPKKVDSELISTLGV